MKYQRKNAHLRAPLLLNEIGKWNGNGKARSHKHGKLSFQEKHFVIHRIQLKILPLVFSVSFNTLTMYQTDRVGNTSGQEIYPKAYNSRIKMTETSQVRCSQRYR